MSKKLLIQAHVRDLERILVPEQVSIRNRAAEVHFWVTGRYGDRALELVEVVSGLETDKSFVTMEL